MSVYASVAEFKARATERMLVGLSDSFILAHLTDASELADAYISQRGYTVPLTTVGNDLKSAVCRIALWTILTARGFNPNAQADEAVRMGHDDAVAFLRDVAKGVANLNTAVTTTARSKTGVAQVFSDPDDGETSAWV